MVGLTEYSDRLHQIDFHGANRAGGNAKLAAVALLRIKKDFLCLFFKGERTGGTKTGAGAAVNALVYVLADAFGQRFDFQPHFFKKMNAPVKIFFFSGEFQNNDAFAAGEYSCFQNIKDEVMLLSQKINDRLLNNIRCVANNYFF